MNNVNRLPFMFIFGLLFSFDIEAANLSLEQQLGKLLYTDKALSLNGNQSCASCHSLDAVRIAKNNRVLPAPGFVDPDNVASGSATSAGSIQGAFGRLNTPSAAYASFSPRPFIDEEGLFVGGQFWNGRAANLQEQAKAPLLNPVEMAMPSQWAVISVIKNNDQYVDLFNQVYGFDLDKVPANTMAPNDDNAPVSVTKAYDLLAQAIAAFEKSRVFNAFTSKFDFVSAGKTSFSEQEQRGFELFKDKAKCSLCHPVDPVTGPDGKTYPSVFTDFTYDNLGLPRNTRIPGNPEPDTGLAATTGKAEDKGKHKVMGLRNIELTPPYGHNGVFATLEEIVNFYNTRDIASKAWAPAEITVNVNTEELGNLGLTASEEADLIAFMKTLTDNYPEWGQDPKVPVGTPSPY